MGLGWLILVFRSLFFCVGFNFIVGFWFSLFLNVL